VQATSSLSGRVGVAAPAPPGVTHVAGMTVARATAVGVPDACNAFLELVFDATAASISRGEPYRDVEFFPEDVVQVKDPQGLCALGFPFVLRNASWKKSMYENRRGSVYCEAGHMHISQLWWATVISACRIIIRNVVTGRSLRTRRSPLPFDERLGVSSADDAPEEWDLLPGDAPGTIRLRSASSRQCLYFDGLFVGCRGEAHPNQDWVIVPKIPRYVGDFVQERKHGRGQFFWPSGAPLFAGRVVEGRAAEGFVFDERSVCHGYYTFDAEGAPAERGHQPEDIADSEVCARCSTQECLATQGRGLDPCGHGVLCEACAGAIGGPGAGAECPLCRSAFHGTMRVR